MTRNFAFRSAGVAAVLALAVGCARPKPEPTPTKPTEVVVDRPVVKEVIEYEDFPGRTEAVAAVDVRARVTGYLNKIEFKDGVDVQKGELLFVIDPTPYQAEANRADATTKLAQAHYDRLEKDFKRVTSLGRQAVSQAELDQVQGDLAEAKASVGVAEAALQLAKQNLDWTRVAAPLSGRISRRLIDPGNLVKADDTILTSIISLDTVYVSFHIDERTLLRLRRLIQEGKMPSARKQETHVMVGLADEDEFSLDGVVNFIDNKVDPGTGTLQVRAEVKNDPRNGNRLLSPGLFIRVRLPIGHPRPAILVPEEAVGTDQGQKFVYVVTPKSEVEYRAVKLGQQFERYRAVESGLGAEDQVIVSGLQRVRPGVKVTAKPAPKPGGAKPAGRKPTPPTAG
jgi:RND family efflux transporter MFP subunit